MNEVDFFCLWNPCNGGNNSYSKKLIYPKVILNIRCIRKLFGKYDSRHLLFLKCLES